MARKDQIAKMRDVLLKRREALRKALAGDLSLLQKLREQSIGDEVDAALDSAQDELNSQLAEVESRELASIENALERMREGEYGQCEACDESIPLVRLQALPYATLCINCQSKLEKAGSRRGSNGNWSRVYDLQADKDIIANDFEFDVS